MTTVHWLAQTEAHLPSDDAWLAADERDVLAGLRFPRRRAEWRLGRWTAKQLFHAIAGLGDPPAFSSISIRAAEDGAPEAVRAGKPVPYVLSISHRDGVAFCALAAGGVALGCDLEKIEPRSERFVADYFTPDEQALVEAAPEVDRPWLANLIWSAKESALKALRAGLRLDTRRAAVQLASPRRGAAWQPMAVVLAEPRRRLNGWYRVDEAYAWTLVAHPAPARPVALKAREDT